MAAIETLENEPDWVACWQAQAAPDAGLLLVFKQSPICPTSHTAEAEFRGCASSLGHPKGLTLKIVDVVHRRPISRRIAEDTGVRHESPQALLIGANQKVLWHASHYQINEDSLRAALAAAGGA